MDVKLENANSAVLRCGLAHGGETRTRAAGIAGLSRGQECMLIPRPSGFAASFMSRIANALRDSFRRLKLLISRHTDVSGDKSCSKLRFPLCQKYTDQHAGLETKIGDCEVDPGPVCAVRVGSYPLADLDVYMIDHRTPLSYWQIRLLAVASDAAAAILSKRKTS
ncbi:hypothetical protein ACOTF6_29505 [Achromobacter xylosoxidans]